jgi:hypothetical protein
MGGAAFKDKTRRILKLEIDPTLKWLAYKTDFSYLYMSDNILGSAGKVESSGDIDINMDINKFDKKVILNALVSVLGPDNVKDWTHVNQIFSCVPICGNPNLGYVQIDFMFGDPRWQKFSYWSPGNSSKFKGLFRTELIKAATAFNSDWTLMDNDELIARVGPTFFHDRGLLWRYRHKAMRKDLKGRVKSFSEISADEFMKLYPSAKKASHSIIINPTEVTEFIFDNKTPETVFDSYESLSEKLREFYGRKSFGTIMDIFLERLNSLKVNIPDEINSEIMSAIKSST